MTIKPLPESASLENMKKRSKALLKSARAGDAEALDRIGPYFGNPRAISLQQAQLVMARTHGFSSWTSLKRQIEADAPSRETPEQRANRFLDLVTVAYGSVPDFGPKRFAMAAELLREHPEIRTANIYTAAAIGDIGQIDAWLASEPGLIDRKGGYFNWQPIMYAAYARLPGVSTLQAGLRLLERGADPNAYYMWGGQYKFTALTGVFGQGEGGPVNQPEHPDYILFARALLEKGANPNDSQAAYNRCFEADNTCFELLLEFGLRGSDKNSWLLCEDDRLLPNPGETMHFHLIQAIHRGNVARAGLLIDHGVDVDKPDDTYDTRTRGKTPYQAAMLLGQPEIAAMLAAAGARPADLSASDAFQSACMVGDLKSARQFLEADPGLAGSVGQTEMLRDAVKLGNKNALLAMIALGFDLNRPAVRTPLHEAALTGDLSIVDLLLDAGSDPTIREPGHFVPPIGFAQYAGHDAIVARLDSVEMDIFTAAARGNIARLEKRLADDPASLERRFAEIRPGDAPCDNDWMTPLACAVLGNQPGAVKYLLARGANPVVADGANNTLLTLAAERSDETMVAMLIDKLPTN